MKHLARSYGQIGRLERATIEARGLNPDLDWFRASTRKLDRHRSILEPEGFDLTDFGGTWGWGHDVYGRHDGSAPPPENVLGSIDATDQTREFLDVGVRWAPHDLANRVRQQLDGGFINGVSVGFIPKLFDWDVWFDENNERVEGDDAGADSEHFMADHYREQELLEVSVVIIPSNPEGQALAVERCMREGLPPGMVRPWNAATPPTPSGTAAIGSDAARRHRALARLRLARGRGALGS